MKSMKSPQKLHNLNEAGCSGRHIGLTILKVYGRTPTNLTTPKIHQRDSWIVPDCLQREKILGPSRLVF